MFYAKRKVYKSKKEREVRRALEPIGPSEGPSRPQRHARHHVRKRCVSI